MARILSAKHGLLDPTRETAPYDASLRKMPVRNRKAWADKVLQELNKRMSKKDRVIILAGNRYRYFLEDPLRKRCASVEVPMQGMPIGKQLHGSLQRPPLPSRTAGTGTQ